jgi:hypothetical protein
MMKGSGSVQTMIDLDLGGQKTYGSTILLSSLEKREKMVRREFLEYISLF